MNMVSGEIFSLCKWFWILFQSRLSQLEMSESFGRQSKITESLGNRRSKIENHRESRKSKTKNRKSQGVSGIKLHLLRSEDVPSSLLIESLNIFSRSGLLTDPPEPSS